MVWFQVDDSMWSHPKILGLSPTAGWLWTRAGAYCAQHLTDGVIPPTALLILGATDDAVADLVGARLWIETPDGYRFHDWHTYQRTRQQVESDRASARDRQAKARARKAQSVTDSVTDSVTAPVSNGVSHGVTNGVSHTARALPNRAEPSRPLEVPKSVTRKRATPPPDVFEITDDMRRWAAAKAPGVNLEDETERLLDWARANGRSYKDWKAAWRNWIKNAKTRTPAARTPPPTTVDKLTALNQRIQARRQAGIA
ncbi:MAG: hypothetical protein QG597_1268 [Actinomycetota bacterium]|nr:hypothetical protein [Actinomycetota bacterium]